MLFLDFNCFSFLFLLLLSLFLLWTVTMHSLASLETESSTQKVMVVNAERCLVGTDKNLSDWVEISSPIHFRYLITLILPISNLWIISRDHYLYEIYCFGSCWEFACVNMWSVLINVLYGLQNNTYYVTLEYRAMRLLTCVV